MHIKRKKYASSCESTRSSYTPRRRRSSRISTKSRKCNTRRYRSRSSYTSSRSSGSSRCCSSKPKRVRRWEFLEHKGPLFAPAYKKLPKNVKLRYNGKPQNLSLRAEEVAGFYAKFIKHKYARKKVFNDNFFKDWRKAMNSKEKKLITKFSKCDFREIHKYFQKVNEEKKAMSKSQKRRIKADNESKERKHGTCKIDGREEKIGNYKVEPPGLFLGRGNHPKMGRVKARITPKDVTINCSRNSISLVSPKSKWKEVRHDNTVTWLACWKENIQGQIKYINLNTSSRLKGENDVMKYDKARELGKEINEIRQNYKADLKSSKMFKRQRAVAIYFIDELALRAGNEKSKDKADTVGCCNLKIQHIKLYDRKARLQYVVQLDFLGKDSIRYQNEVSVERDVFSNLKQFCKNKKKGEKLFDELNTQILNKYLNGLMDGLTAKVFRTCNASIKLEQELQKLTPKKGTTPEKILAYNRANRAVAILCNHQRAVPKTYEKTMKNLQCKIDDKEDEIKKLKKDLKCINKRKYKKKYETKQNQIKRAEDQLDRLRIKKDDMKEGKTIALGTSKLNYLDPRITVAWCKKHNIAIEKIYNKTQRARFHWAITTADKTFNFANASKSSKRKRRRESSSSKSSSKRSKKSKK